MIKIIPGTQPVYRESSALFIYTNGGDISRGKTKTESPHNHSLCYPRLTAVDVVEALFSVFSFYFSVLLVSLEYIACVDFGLHIVKRTVVAVGNDGL